MNHVILALSAAVILAGTTHASAQVYRDDPPGSRFQTRGLSEASGVDPYRYRYRRGFTYRAYAYGVPRVYRWRR